MFDSPLSNEYKKLRLKKSKKEVEFQEVFLDRLAQEREEEGFERKKLEVPLSQKVLQGLYLIFLGVAIMFLGKTLELQVFSGTEFTVLAQRNTIRSTPIFADRGVIYDNSMRQLVFNKPSFDLICDKRDMPQGSSEKETMIREISKILSMPFGELEKKIDESQSPEALIVENISHGQLVLLETKIQDFKGCQIREGRIREYPDGQVFAHLLGYAAKISPEELQQNPNYFFVDQIGKTGIEKSYEAVLRGEPGKTVIEKDSFGNTIQEIGEFAPTPGKSTVLWIDSELQQKITAAIIRILQATGTTKAAAVALDPRTGGILALVSLPGFDNNLFTQGITSETWESLTKNPLNPLFNRAISGIGYPTGSVIKPLIGVAALQEGIVTENTILYSPLEICVQNKYTGIDECFRDWTFHGDSNIKRAIAESVNTFFYMIGGGYENLKGLGVSKIIEYVKLFGWGKSTGIDLPNEGKGILPTIDENWRLGDTYHLSIGQGPFAMTPLQVATAFSAIANGGTLLQPQVVQKIVDAQKNLVEEFEPKIIRQNFVDPENIAAIKKGMRQTVTAGSATGWLDDLPVKVAAKTGTAQIGKKDWDGKDFLYSWTVSFVPSENPEIVFVVVVEDAKEGTFTSLPITREVLQWYFTK